jgi:hypothetical protein
MIQRWQMAALTLTGLVACGGGSGGTDPDASRAQADASAELDASAPLADADVTLPDAALPDAALPDAGLPDASPPLPDAAPIMADAAPPPEPDASLAADAGAPADPDLLSGQGLYTDIASRTLAADVQVYDPVYHLWSDGAVNTRWIKLPPGGVIDTSDMDHWRFPVGTKFFKQFTRDGVDCETRVITQTGPSDGDTRLQSFVWLPDQSDAVYTPDGATDVNGTDHDVPPENQCSFCHQGQPSMILGFQAVQLSRPGAGLTLDNLRASGTLSDPPPAGTSYALPGTSVQRNALGYLHANCGHCHYPGGFPETAYGIDMDLFVTAASTAGAVQDLPPWATTVDQPLDHFEQPGGPLMFRVVSGMPAQSAIVFRMSSRGNDDQMPPYATELPDLTGGLADVIAWINDL